MQLNTPLVRSTSTSQMTAPSGAFAELLRRVGEAVLHPEDNHRMNAARKSLTVSSPNETAGGQATGTIFRGHTVTQAARFSRPA
jgi:hypothetical protein